MIKSNNISETKISSSKNLHLKNLNLTEALKQAKEKDQDATLTLINKYSPLVDKYSRIYKLKDYEKSDLQQEGKIAIINAIDKFDLSKNTNVLDGYIINSIRNKYGTLARTHIKRNTESSLNIHTNHEYSSLIIDLIQDTIDLDQFNRSLKTGKRKRPGCNTYINK